MPLAFLEKKKKKKKPLKKKFGFKNKKTQLAN